jgi:hypothetical protein
MKVTVVDVYPSSSSLESQRGVFTNGVIVLPDPLSPGEVLVRARHNLSSSVVVMENGEIDVEVPSELACEHAVNTHMYNLGWFRTFFESHLEAAKNQTTKGN